MHPIVGSGVKAGAAPTGPRGEEGATLAKPQASPARPSFLLRRWRLLLAAAVAAAVVMLARRGALPPGLATLIGWDAGCVAFLATTFSMMLKDDEATVRARAAYEDEGQTVTLIVVLLAVLASLAATVVAMREAKGVGASGSSATAMAALVSVLTLVLGWLVLQTMFALRYAHRYFGDGDRDGVIDGGAKFPGAAPSTYQDFVYLSVCVGATAQVSDVDITTARYRRLVTQHALVAFFFNTMVLALGINILATIIGK